VKLPEKIEIFENLPGKIDFFYPDPRPPQISNQIDATGMLSTRKYAKLRKYVGG